jgi:hypothetical protein
MLHPYMRTLDQLALQDLHFTTLFKPSPAHSTVAQAASCVASRDDDLDKPYCLRSHRLALQQISSAHQSTAS